MMRHRNVTALHRTLTDNVIFFLFYNVKSQFFISASITVLSVSVSL